jgi:formylglycine-generating enzyme required for sulfatase activity
MEMLMMLIRIEEGNHGNHWIVRLDDYPVTCRDWQEAKAFADRMKSRIDAPHALPPAAARQAPSTPAPATAP